MTSANWDSPIIFKLASKESLKRSDLNGIRNHELSETSEVPQPTQQSYQSNWELGM